MRISRAKERNESLFSLMNDLVRKSTRAFHVNAKNHPELFDSLIHPAGTNFVYYPKIKPSDFILSLFPPKSKSSVFARVGASTLLEKTVIYQICYYHALLTLLQRKMGISKGNYYFDLLFTADETKLVISNSEIYDKKFGNKAKIIHPLFALIKIDAFSQDLNTNITISFDVDRLRVLIQRPNASIEEIKTIIRYETTLANNTNAATNERIITDLSDIQNKRDKYYRRGILARKNLEEKDAHIFFSAGLLCARELYFHLVNNKAPENELISAENSIILHCLNTALIYKQRLYEVEERLNGNYDLIINYTQAFSIQGEEFFSKRDYVEAAKYFQLTCEYAQLCYNYLKEVKPPIASNFQSELILAEMRIGTAFALANHAFDMRLINNAMELVDNNINQFQDTIYKFYKNGEALYLEQDFESAKYSFLFYLYNNLYLHQYCVDKGIAGKEELAAITQKIAIAAFNLGSVELQSKHDSSQGFLLLNDALQYASVYFGKDHKVTKLIRKYAQTKMDLTYQSNSLVSQQRFFVEGYKNNNTDTSLKRIVARPN